MFLCLNKKFFSIILAFLILTAGIFLIVLDGTVYSVIDIIQDYDLDEYSVFVEEYNYDLGE